MCALCALHTYVRTMWNISSSINTHFGRAFYHTLLDLFPPPCPEPPFTKHRSAQSAALHDRPSCIQTFANNMHINKQQFDVVGRAEIALYIIHTWKTFHIYMHTYVYMYKSIYLSLYICVSVCFNTCIDTYTYIYVYVYVYIRTYVYIYIHIYVHVDCVSLSLRCSVVMCVALKCSWWCVVWCADYLHPSNE